MDGVAGHDLPAGRVAVLQGADQNRLAGAQMQVFDFLRAGDAGFDVLIACAFNYDAQSAEFMKLGRVPILKARMPPSSHPSVKPTRYVF